jgi:tRNA(fMet)-specific endonuclease VapC
MPEASAAKLLDTSTLSDVIKGLDRAVEERAIAYLSHHGRFTFSLITRYGILRGLHAQSAERQLERFEVQCSHSVVLPVTDGVVLRAAKIYGQLWQRGELIEDADVLIAATALEHGLALVTENAAPRTRRRC